MANVIPLVPDRPPVAQYIRIGIAVHNQLEQLLESGPGGCVAHGVGIIERFDTRIWDKRPEKRSGGSAGTRALITAQHYLSQILAPTDRQARTFNRLKIADLKPKKILDEGTHRVEYLLRVLEHFHIATADDSRRASSPKLRYGNRPNSASAQR